VKTRLRAHKHVILWNAASNCTFYLYSRFTPSWPEIRARPVNRATVYTPEESEMRPASRDQLKQKSPSLLSLSLSLSFSLSLSLWRSRQLFNDNLSRCKRQPRSILVLAATFFRWRCRVEFQSEGELGRESRSFELLVRSRSSQRRSRSFRGVRLKVSLVAAPSENPATGPSTNVASATVLPCN